jgi:hypothetical protein
MNMSAGRLAALPTLLLVLAFVVQATRTLEGGQDTGALAAGDLAAADRVVVYQLTRAGGPRFRLPGGPEQIHLFVHLELPRALTSAVPGGLYRFGVTATLRGPDGAELWERTVTQRTRQAADGRGPDGDEEVVALGSRVALSESGSLELSVPAAPVGAVLELRLADAAGLLAADGGKILAPITAPTALVRAYRRIAVDPAQAELRRLALAADAGARRLAAATYLPWYALQEQQQRQRLTTAWERLAAEGRAGVDYEVRSLYLAPPAPAALPAPGEPALTVGEGQPVALQIVGPGALEVRAWPIARVAADGEATLELRLRRLSPTPTPERLAAARAGKPVPEDSTEKPVLADSSKPAAPDPAQEMVRAVVLRPGELLREPLTVGPGWWTLELHSALAEVAVQVRGDAAERHAGPEDHAQHHDHAGQAFLPVDLRLLPLYLLGPDQPALPVALHKGGDVDARLVQVDVRALGELRAVPVSYSFVDANGVELAAGASLAETTRPAPFERLRRPSAVAGDVPEDRSLIAAAEASPTAVVEPVAPPVGAGTPTLALGFPLGDAPVSEPVTLRLLAPGGAAGLRLRTEEPALIAVHGRLPERVREAGPDWTWPYDQVEDTALRWRYAPRAEPRAFPRRADDHADRVAGGQVLLLQAQVRAEPTAPVEAGGSTWRAEHPRGAHARLRVLERVPPDRRGDAIARWGPGSYMRLRRAAREAIDLGPGGPLTARALFQATGSGTAVVGQPMALAVGGQTMRWTVSGRAGHKPLPGRGVTEVSWDEGPAEMLVLLDRPPVRGSGAPIYEMRQLHRLGGGGLTVTIDKPGNEPVALNMVLYWLEGAPREATALQIEIDGGTPRRREAAQVSALTPGTRALQVLPARRTEVVLADRRGLSGAGLARVAAVLGDDLAPGRHTVRVTPLSGPPVWLRFFREGQAPSQGGALQWNERRDGVTLEDSDDEEE